MPEDMKPLDLNSDQPMEASATPETPQTMPTGNPKKKMLITFLILVLLGAASGYGLSKVRPGASAPKKLKSASEGVTVGSTYGIEDAQAFKDTAEGELAAGGIDGEGSHHLVREGGESQYVYLTSSIVDLDQFVGHKVKVWGATFAAQQAGWLMDVGRLQVLE